jgi:hypothetical protein
MRTAPIYKIPFTVRLGELTSFAAGTPLFGGLGPLYGSVLLLLLTANLVLLARGHLAVIPWTLAAALIAAVSLLNPEAWWMRLAPQFWLVPLCLLVPLYYGTSLPSRAVRVVALAALLLNVGMVAGVHLGVCGAKAIDFKRQVEALQEVSQEHTLEVTPPFPFSPDQMNELTRTQQEQIPLHKNFGPAALLRLRRAGLEFQEAARPSCDSPLQMVGYGQPGSGRTMRVCLADAPGKSIDATTLTDVLRDLRDGRIPLSQALRQFFRML